MDVRLDGGGGLRAVLGDEFDKRRADDDAIGLPANCGGLFGCADAEADGDGERRGGLELGDRALDARLRGLLQAGDARDRDVIDEAARAAQDHRQPRGIGGGGGEADEVDAGGAQRGAELLIFLRRQIDADDAIDARLCALSHEPVAATDRHRVGIAHQHERDLGVAGAEGGGNGENVRRFGARGEAAQIGGLDRGAIGHRIGKGHAELDDIGSARNERVKIGGGVAIARGDERYERGAVGGGTGGESGGEAGHSVSTKSSAMETVLWAQSSYNSARVRRERHSDRLVSRAISSSTSLEIKTQWHMREAVKGRVP